MRKIAIETYGCTLNQADSNIMAAELARAGYSVEVLPHNAKTDAEMLIVNTCTVKTPTEQKIIERLKGLKGYKGKLIVAGCMASANQDEIEKVAPEASVVTTSNIGSIVAAVEEIERGGRAVLNGYSRVDKLSYPISYSTIAKIPISEGCLSNCSFCETKFARGPLNSFSEKLILKAIEISVAGGAREIELTSQDTGAYGRDRSTDIAELVSKASMIEGRFMIRVGMLNPEHLGRYIDRLIDVYNSEKVYKFVHLPVQSGSDKVLKEMNRKYSVDDFIGYVKEFRSKMPNISIATDIIVGYPTETESDFEETLELIRKVKPSITNVSKFGRRPHAPASMLEQLGNDIVKRRSIDASRLVREVQAKARENFIGSEEVVLVTEGGRSMKGRDIYYNQVALENDAELGSFVNAKITGSSAGCLLGRAISKA
ncbi:MAG: tRNA (N(6)-L-threonylcarbamoyladenosine(37)-C(2))-methylthiotransferase [Candidatus Micrarchaeia archaeon]